MTSAETAICLSAAIFEPCQWDGNGIVPNTCDRVMFLQKCRTTGSKVQQAKCVRKLSSLLIEARQIKKTVTSAVVKAETAVYAVRTKVSNIKSKINDFEAALSQCWKSFDDTLEGTARKILCISMVALSPCKQTTDSSGVVSWTCKTVNDIKTCGSDLVYSSTLQASCKITPCPIGIGPASPKCENKQCMCKSGYSTLNGQTCVPTPAPKTDLEKKVCVFNQIFAPCGKAATYDWDAVTAVCDKYPEILSRYQALRACLPDGTQEGGALSVAETGLCMAAAVFEPCHWDNKVGATCRTVDLLRKCYTTTSTIKRANCVRKLLPLLKDVSTDVVGVVRLGFDLV